MKTIKYLVNHYSAGPATQSVEDIRRFHKAKGWRDIGYHRIILHPDTVPDAHDWYDLVKLGRHLDDDKWLEPDEIGAHALGLNSESVGICTIGSPQYPLHPLQREAIIEVNKILLKRFSLTPSAIIGHQETLKMGFPGAVATSCPGSEIMQVIKELRKS